MITPKDCEGYDYIAIKVTKEQNPIITSLLISWGFKDKAPDKNAGVLYLEKNGYIYWVAEKFPHQDYKLKWITAESLLSTEPDAEGNYW